MQSSNIPSKIPLPFAYAAGSSYKNTIPTASQIGITNGKASLTDGFPPLTFQPLSSGGVPPFGADFNGILNEITSIQQWQEAGGFFPFDATFASQVGGYPKGAVIQSATFNGFWVSNIENNSSNPDTNGVTAGWVPFGFDKGLGITLTSTTTTLTNIQAAYPILNFSGTLTANSTVILPTFEQTWVIANATSGAYTLTVKTASGGGVNIPQGGTSIVYGDSLNIKYANSAQVSSFNGRTGAISLNATDVINALGYTPVAPTDFPASLTATGYQKLPNGLIFQWGIATSSGMAAGNGSITFPIAFPNNCLTLSATPYGGDTQNRQVVAYTYTPTTAWYTTFLLGNSFPITFYWFALGY